MSEHERSRTMPAPPEVVFDQARDLDRLDHWLPQDLHVRPEVLPAVTVHEDSTGQDAHALMRADPDQLRIEWGTRDDDRYAGWLQVADSGSGASEVTIHLSFFDDAHAPGGDDIDTTLEDSLQRLAEEVRLRTDSAAG
ncbi:SRPBCC family protein [Streptosporangium sp. CA-135522]|uniref:SRPBCC family protein n=1 Tax=Streptosporangium sp. CA-135522 TaxID=3240072 RepID=UPI003D940CBB